MSPNTQTGESINVWWVNQGRTYAHESAGGYFWAPLHDRRGGTPHHWQRMAEVKRGDIVLHYGEGHIRAVSRVEKDAYRALYPLGSHGDYGGREGNLVETTYYALAEPIGRDVAAGLGSLPATGNPFTSTGAVIQGYLFVFGAEALKELVALTPSLWPEWILEFAASGQRPETLEQHPVLQRFLEQLRNLNVAIVEGRRMKYKPIMLLSAMRTLLDEETVDFGPPLLDHYAQFCRAINADPSRPNQPYFHLISDAVWQLYNDDGTVFTSTGTPNLGPLRTTYAEFTPGIDVYITDPTWRPLLFAALRTHFDAAEWRNLVRVWPELAPAGFLPGNIVAESSLTPEEIRELFGNTILHFSQALQNSHLRFGQHHDDFVRRFVASLATKPFIILTGLSGSGKTQIAQQFGHWVGEKQLLIVPVRPDWTGSDALFGYEDALRPLADDGYRAWHVPEPLRFMLEAARDPKRPYVLVLDEMNLAHVERYFADVLSGMESGEPCLPNLAEDDDGHWRLLRDEPEAIPVPDNLFIIGTVNVDETTYMFSPKVLDRANTIEFRVETDDLMVDARKPTRCEAGPEELIRGFLGAATDVEFHSRWPHPNQHEIAGQLRRLHGALYDAGFEFGHRVFWESLRFAAMFAAAGDDDTAKALDAIVLQKVLPRLHGNRRRLEPVLTVLGYFCYVLPSLESDFNMNVADGFDPLNPPASDERPRLPGAFAKIRRMTRSVQVNQFASFAE